MNNKKILDLVDILYDEMNNTPAGHHNYFTNEYLGLSAQYDDNFITDTIEMNLNVVSDYAIFNFVFNLKNIDDYQDLKNLAKFIIESGFDSNIDNQVCIRKKTKNSNSLLIQELSKSIPRLYSGDLEIDEFNKNLIPIIGLEKVNKLNIKFDKTYKQTNEYFR